MDKFIIEILFWAEEDLSEIAKYYENLSKGLGDKFYCEVRIIIESLKINPFYQISNGDIRKISIEKFPYSIYFKVNEIDKKVYIEAIINDYLLPFSKIIKK